MYQLDNKCFLMTGEFASNNRMVNRGFRNPDEGRRVAAIVREIPHSPNEVLRRLAAEALLFCRAHSAGVNLFAEDTPHVLRAVAVVGPWSRCVSTIVTRHSPETVIATDRSARLFSRPANTLMLGNMAQPPAIEMLMARLSTPDHLFGTTWAVLHDQERSFTSEDAHRLQVLSDCAAASYQVARSFHDVQTAVAPTADMSTVAALPPAVRDSTSPMRRPLSAREHEVCVLVARGHTNKHIAALLGVTVKSVETYRARVCDKLGFRNRADFVTHASAQGWF